MPHWILLLALLALHQAAQPQAAPPPRPGRAEIREMIQQGKYSDARKALAELLASDGSEKGELHYLLGLVEVRQGDLQKATAEFNKSLEINPGEPAALLMLAKTLLALNRYGEAERVLLEVTSAAPFGAEGWSLLGRLYLGWEDYAGALPALAKAVSQGGADIPTISMFAMANLGSGRIDEAERWFNRASAQNDRLKEPFAETYAAYGHFLVRTNRLREAGWQIGLALRIEPGNLIALQARRALEARMRDRRPARSRGATLPPPRFEEIAGRAGIDFRLSNSATPAKLRIETMLGGVAVLDFDGDGWMDLFFTNGGASPTLEKKGPEHWNRLYRNRGDGTFEDATVKANLQGERYACAAAAADYDNDGRPDLFVAGVDRNALYRNKGDGTFREVAASAGLDRPHPEHGRLWSIHAAWLDYDNDGWLDLLVVNHSAWDPKSEPACTSARLGLRRTCSAQRFQPVPNSLYRNNRDGSFTDVSAPSGIGRHPGKGTAAAVADFDGDGLVDIFVPNDGMADFLFRSRGDGTFEEIGKPARIDANSLGVQVTSRGADARDLDNDGRPDLFITAMPNESFQLFANTGPAFADVADIAGVGLASLAYGGWSAAAADLNNDGWKDLFSANGHYIDNIERLQGRLYRQANAVFLNQGDGTFHDESAAAGPQFRQPTAHRGAAAADFDNDGRMDLAVSALGESAELWHNVSPAAGNWLLVLLRGHASNRDGIGARLQLETDDGRVLYNHASTSAGFASSGDPRVHFGLGKSRMVRRLRVAWPSGRTQALENLAPNRVLFVEEPH